MPITFPTTLFTASSGFSQTAIDAADDWQTRSTNSSATSYNAVLQLFQDLIDAGLWNNTPASDKILRMNMFCGDDLTACLTPQIVGGGHATDTNNNFLSGDYSESAGLAGNGSSKYLETGWVPSVELSSSLDAHMGFYVTAGADNYLGAVITSAVDNERFLLIDFFDGGAGNWKLQARIGGTDMGVINGSTRFTNFTGHALVTTRSSNDGELYEDGSSVGTETSFTLDRLPNDDIWVFVAQSAGSPSGYSAQTQAGYHFGKGLTDQEAADLYAAIQAFQTTLSRAA